MKTLIKEITRKSNAQKVADRLNSELNKELSANFFEIEKLENGNWGVFEISPETEIKNEEIEMNQENENLDESSEEMYEAFKAIKTIVVKATEEGAEDTTKEESKIFLVKEDAEKFAGKDGKVETIEIGQEEMEEIAKSDIAAANQRKENISAGVKSSWADSATRAARMSRINIRVAQCRIVTENEKSTALPLEGQEDFEFIEFKSVTKAFQHLKLAMNKHITFRGKLREAGKMVYQENDKSYLFEVVGIETPEEREAAKEKAKAEAEAKAKAEAEAEAEAKAEKAETEEKPKRGRKAKKETAEAAEATEAA